MQIPEDQILSLLEGRGDDAAAQRAETELPDTVDTDAHAGLLSELGIDPAELLTTLGGGGLGGGTTGGIAGKLGL